MGWDVLHDQGGEGAHHARIVRFLREHKVVVASRIGPGKRRTVDSAGRAQGSVQGDDPRHEFGLRRHLRVAPRPVLPSTQTGTIRQLA